MKIALFGASGRTGKEVLIQSLIKGYQVKALVRRSDALDIKDDKLETITGDVMDADVVGRVIEGCQAVMVALGARTQAEAHVVAEGTKNILEAMDKSGVLRIVVVSSTELIEGKEKNHLLGNKTRPFFLKKIPEEKIRQFEYLKNSQTEWILVRSTTMIDATKTGKYYITLDKPAGKRIGRSDVADFMLGQLNGSKYLRQMPIISY